MTQHDGDSRMTVVQAAEILNLTPDAIRARLRRGTLSGGQDNNGSWYVLLDDTTPDSRDSRSTSAPTAALLGAKDQTIASLNDQVRHLREQLRSAEERDRETRRIIAALTQRIPELPAPQDAPSGVREDPVEATQGQDTATGPTDEAEEPRRPWWVRWFG